MIDKQAIKARLDAATPGPWKHFVWDQEHLVRDGNGRCIVDAVGLSLPNANFIANAPTDIGALLAEIERLEGELAKFKECPYGNYCTDSSHDHYIKEGE